MSSRDDPSALGGAEAKAKSRSSLFPLASSYLNSSAPHRGLFPIPTQVHASNPALPGPSATWVADASFDSRLLPKPPAIPALALSQAGYSIERDAPDLGLRSHSEAGTETSTSSGEAEGEAEKAQGSKGLPLQAKVKEKESKKKSKSKSKRDRGRSSSEEDGEGGEGDRSQRRESKRRKKRRRKRRERGEEEEEREKRRLARRAREEEAAGREGIGSLAGSAVERKPAVSRWMESKALPPQEYYVDTRGDRDNLAFGSLYRCGAFFPPAPSLSHPFLPPSPPTQPDPPPPVCPPLIAPWVQLSTPNPGIPDKNSNARKLGLFQKVANLQT
eukprot:jgi/Mesen1/6702/ME000343S05865